MDDEPFILTARFDEESFRFFDGMRKRHFPAKRNVIPAHLTLFHALPPEDESEITAAVEALAASSESMTLAITGLRFLGYGSAYEVRAPRLAALRAELATRWADRLTRQDAQTFRPHVTIQNKAAAPVAKALYEELSSSFEPFDARATGLILWRYRGGPWESVRGFSFADE